MLRLIFIKILLKKEKKGGGKVDDGTKVEDVPKTYFPDKIVWTPVANWWQHSSSPAKKYYRTVNNTKKKKK